MRRKNVKTICMATAMLSIAMSIGAFAGPKVYGTVVTKEVQDPTMGSDTGTDGRPANMDDATWVRLQDDVIDYDEIPNLVEYRSILSKQQDAAIDNYAVNINEIVSSIDSSIDDINGQISDLKDRRNQATTESEKAYFTGLINTLSSMISASGTDNYGVISYDDDGNAVGKTTLSNQKASAAGNLTKIASNIKRSLHGTKVTITTGMYSAFIGYHTLSELSDIYKKQVDLYKTTYDKTVMQQAVGSATALEVRNAEANLKNAENNLLDNAEKMRNIKEQMAIVLGWTPTDLNRVTIGAMPQYDSMYMASRNLDSDIAEARLHNVAYGTAAGTVDKDILAYTTTDIKRNEAKESLNVTMSGLYNTAVEAGTKYEAAQAGFILAKRQKEAAERSYAAGLMGNAEYSGAITQYIASEAQADMAAIEASAAVLNYQAALKGYV